MSIRIVDPAILRKAVQIFYEWAEAGSEGQDMEMRGPDLGEFLDKLTADLKTEPDETVALFQRVIALEAYCLRTSISDELFDDDGLPGAKLCSAAARASVLDLPGGEEGVVTHSFDAEAMNQALRDSSN